MDTIKSKEFRRRANLSLAGCILIIMLNYGTTTFISIYMNDLCMTMNASMTQISLLFTVQSAVGAVTALLTSVLLDRYRCSVKLLTTIGAIAFLLFFIIMAVSHSLLVFYVGAALFGVGAVLLGNATMQPVIGWWHTKNLGVKISSLSISFSIAGAVFSILFAKLLASLGFHATVLLHGVTFFIIYILCTFFLVSERPEKYGLAEYVRSPESNIIEKNDVDAADHSSTHYLRTVSCWCILFVSFTVTMFTSGFLTNAANIYSSTGLDAITSASMISIQSICTALFLFVYGVLNDRFSSVKATCVMAFASSAAFAANCLIVNGSYGVLGAIIMAILNGSTNYVSMIGALAFAELYGRGSLSSLVPLAMVASYAGKMVGAPIGSMIFQVTGSFSLFMLLGLTVNIVALLLLLLLRKAVRIHS